MIDNLKEMTSLIIRNKGDFSPNGDRLKVSIPMGEGCSAEIQMSAKDFEEFCWQVQENRASLV